MLHIKIKLLKLLLHILGFVRREKYKYSQEYEDNFKYMSLKEKLWWGYKSLIRQVERAEKGKGIEEYFENQDLQFLQNESFEEISSLTITAGGDLSCSEVIYPEGTLNLWDDIKEFFFSGDIVCANLESPLDTSKPAVGVPDVCLCAPNLNTTPQMFDRFIFGAKGINFFSTANNHSLDMGESGIITTLDFIDSKGYKHVGTSRTPEEQRDIPVIEVNGIRVAFLAYTYCLNSYDPIPGKEYMTNVIRLNKPGTDLGLIKEHVKVAHEKNADIIVAMLHWSLEFETYPIQNIIDMGHRVMEECGVDVIFGGHPHVAQPMEKYKFIDPFTREEKEGFIIYSLGEFVSYNAFSKNSRLALTIKLKISKDKGNSKTKITGLKVMPVYTLVRKLNNVKWDYRLINFVKLMKNLDQNINPFDFTKKEIKELKRLEKLLYKRLLPRKQKHIIEGGSSNI